MRLIASSCEADEAREGTDGGSGIGTGRCERAGTLFGSRGALERRAIVANALVAGRRIVRLCLSRLLHVFEESP